MNTTNFKKKESNFAKILWLRITTESRQTLSRTKGQTTTRTLMKSRTIPLIFYSDSLNKKIPMLN